MAPFIQSTLQILMGYMYTESPISHLDKSRPRPGVQEPVIANGGGGTPSIAVASFSPGHLSVFGIDKSSSSVSHKLMYDGVWMERGTEMELLGGRFSGPPAAVSVNGSIDVFGIDDFGEDLRHKSFDGVNWYPGQNTWINLGGTDMLSSDSAVSIVSRAPGWQDIFTQGNFEEDETQYNLYHKYHDGSSWSEWQKLGGEMYSSPVAIAPELNEIEVFAHTEGTIEKLLWDGSTWSEWHETNLHTMYADPTLTTARDGRYDLFFVENDEYKGLFHLNSDRGLEEEETVGGLDGPKFSGKPAVIGTQGGKDEPKRRIDVVMLGEDGQYYHNNGSGIDDWGNWTSHGGSFSSAPVIISWENDTAQRLDVFGVTSGGQLAHQAWNETEWYPAIDRWEIIGENLKTF